MSTLTTAMEMMVVVVIKSRYITKTYHDENNVNDNKNDNDLATTTMNSTAASSK